MSLYTETTLKVSEVSFAEHEQLISLAKDRNIGAATQLMGDAAILIKHGVALPEPLATYIGEALYNSGASSISGCMPDEAFNVKRGQGGNKHTSQVEAYRLCLEVELNYRSIRNYEKSYIEIADARDYKDAKSVKRAYLKNRKKWGIKDKAESELRDMLDAVGELLEMKAV
jgi:hypothetical protein